MEKSLILNTRKIQSGRWRLVDCFRLADQQETIRKQYARSLTSSERLELELGITCHAIYHAGQIQLIKKLRTNSEHQQRS